MSRISSFASQYNTLGFLNINQPRYTLSANVSQQREGNSILFSVVTNNPTANLFYDITTAAGNITIDDFVDYTLTGQISLTNKIGNFVKTLTSNIREIDRDEFFIDLKLNSLEGPTLKRLPIVIFEAPGFQFVEDLNIGSNGSTGLICKLYAEDATLIVGDWGYNSYEGRLLVYDRVGTNTYNQTWEFVQQIDKPASFVSAFGLEFDGSKDGKYLLANNYVYKRSGNTYFFFQNLNSESTVEDNRYNTISGNGNVIYIANPTTNNVQQFKLTNNQYTHTANVHIAMPANGNGIIVDTTGTRSSFYKVYPRDFGTTLATNYTGNDLAVLALTHMDLTSDIGKFYTQAGQGYFFTENDVTYNPPQLYFVSGFGSNFGYGYANFFGIDNSRTKFSDDGSSLIIHNPQDDFGTASVNTYIKNVHVKQIRKLSGLRRPFNTQVIYSENGNVTTGGITGFMLSSNGHILVTHDDYGSKKQALIYEKNGNLYIKSEVINPDAIEQTNSSWTRAVVSNDAEHMVRDDYNFTVESEAKYYANNQHYFYSVSTDKTEVRSGDYITVTVDTDNIPNYSNLFWQVKPVDESNGTINAQTFQYSVYSGNVMIVNNQGTARTAIGDLIRITTTSSKANINSSFKIQIKADHRFPSNAGTILMSTDTIKIIP